ncbi:MAG: hypothetical protein ABI675_15640 [Chitinophagaceae bacterium]
MKIVFLFLPVFILLNCSLQAQTNKEYVTIENYYRVKWGYAEEFSDLWKANHYPLLKRQLKKEIS